MHDLIARLQAALGPGYRVERELGGGGMSRVFLCDELELGRRVVVKLLPPEMSAGVNLDRFRRETQVAAKLQHPHIVPLLSAGSAGDLLYYVMPFIEGESLRARLQREGELPVPATVRILRDVADALAYAHARGVVHRDIKPDNVLISGHHALVTDFGVAKALTQSSGGSSLTALGIAIGTPAYMAPEQAAGDPQVDHRADLYAVGAMAYEMLSGQPPFIGASPQQVLAAHVTAPVDPITKHRPAVPPALSEVVMRCLEKQPATRWQSAAELHQALDAAITPLGTTTSPSLARHWSGSRRWLLRLGISAVVLVGVLAAGWAAIRSRASHALDRHLVAVAPFEVLDRDLELWREGLVDVLSRSLDGAGPLRTVSPTLVVRRWSGRPDPTAAGELGRGTGASLVVFGDLVRSGRDSVRVTASVLDLQNGRALRQLELRDEADRMDRLADSLAVAILGEIGRARPVGVLRSATWGATSLPALRAFLQGEQFLRRSAWDSALVYYQQAIALDSTFVPALRHAGAAAGWQHSAYDTLTRGYKLRAGALNHGLAARESLLVAADSLTGALNAGPNQLGAAWWGYARRLLSTLGEAATRYPDDPEVWHELGDIRFHSLGYSEVTERETLDAFDRAIGLDSAFSPAYVHAVELALRLDGVAAGRRYATAFLGTQAAGRHAEAMRLLLRLLDRRDAAAPETQSTLDTASFSLLAAVLANVRQLPDSGETAIRVARELVERRLASPEGAPPIGAKVPLAQALAFRGHLAGAYAELGASVTPAQLFVDLALLGLVPPDSVERVTRKWLAPPGPSGSPAWFAAPWWAARRDTASLAALRRWAEGGVRSLPPGVPPVAQTILGYVVRSADAYHALARGDTAEALRRFEALPDTACFGNCPLDRLTLAQLLEAAGRLTDAATVVDRPLTPFGIGLSEVLRMLARGRVHERLGHREIAQAAYGYVVDAWGAGDPEVQPFVEEARAGLRRLGGERLR